MPERVVLEGEVVRLEPLDFVHVDGLVAAASEDRTTYDFTLVPADRASMREYVASALDDEQIGWALPFAIHRLADARIVGSTRFLDLDYWETGIAAWPPGRPSAGGAGAPSTAEIGSTWLAASAQATPVNTEAKLLLLRHAFDTWRVERVTFKTDARNERSRRAIERIGATFEGVRRAHTIASDGTIRDSAYFSIVRSEWPAIEHELERRLPTRT
ncbi:MAG: GNAT family protein [Acidimicrobiia bacterium]